MDTNCEKRGRVLIVNLPYELDHSESAIIKDEIERYFKFNQIKYVIFDFSNTCFMDSAGIGLIMGRYNKVKLQEGSVFISGVSTSMDRVLTISGLYRIITKFVDVKEAMEYIEKKS